MKKTDLPQIEKKLIKERGDIMQRIELLKKDDPFNDPDYASNNAAVDTDVREQEAHQRIEAEIKSLQQRTQDIQVALDRVKKGRYGICKRCNISIPPKRLELIPETQYCVTCESELKK
jgi:DnaK suppressor protein